MQSWKANLVGVAPSSLETAVIINFNSSKVSVKCTAVASFSQSSSAFALAAASDHLLSTDPCVQVPFVLTPAAKSKIVMGISKEKRNQASSMHALHAMLHGYHPSEAIYLKIRVRRSHILQVSHAVGAIAVPCWRFYAASC